MVRLCAGECLRHGSQSCSRSLSEPLFCTCATGLEDDSIEMAMRRAKAEVILDTLARRKSLHIPPVKSRKPRNTREGRKATAVAAGCRLADADDKLIADAMLRSAAEAEAMDAKHARLGFELVKDLELRARVKAFRAMHRANWKPRFHIGDVVECNLSAGWKRATVRQQRYREPEWGKGRIAAYQVRLDDGTLIFVPMDHDSLVRKVEINLCRGT